MTPPDDGLLLAAPNVSEGRDQAIVEAIAGAFTATGAQLLDVHSDPDHNRSVFTLAAGPDRLVEALMSGARAAVELVDMRSHEGVHPCVGALDVAPVVYLDRVRRGAACAEALVVADELARELDLPVLLYGALAGGRRRSELRQGGLPGLAARMQAGHHLADFGPSEPHPTAGVTLVSARPPLVAFNVELAAPASAHHAAAIAARLREGGPDGLPGLRAIGLWLASRRAAQVSFNVEEPFDVTLAQVLDGVRRQAPVSAVELVGLAPRAALEGFPDDVLWRGPAPPNRAIENALGL